MESNETLRGAGQQESPYDIRVRKALDDIAIMLGKITETHKLGFVPLWDMMKHLDFVRVELMLDLRKLHVPSNENPKTHPAAVEDFIRQNHARTDEY
jgi:hypothetical protein